MGITNVANDEAVWQVGRTYFKVIEIKYHGFFFGVSSWKHKGAKNIVPVPEGHWASTVTRIDSSISINTSRVVRWRWIYVAGMWGSSFRAAATDGKRILLGDDLLRFSATDLLRSVLPLWHEQQQQLPGPQKGTALMFFGGRHRRERENWNMGLVRIRSFLETVKKGHWKTKTVRHARTSLRIFANDTFRYFRPCARRASVPGRLYFKSYHV